MKLTKAIIDKLVYSGTKTKDGSFTRDVRWDGTLPGFGIRLLPSGRKVFILSFRLKRRKRLMTLGTYGILTLDQAKHKARIAAGQVSDQKNPMAARDAEMGEKTIAALCRQFLDQHSRPHKKSCYHDQRRIRLYILPTWKNRLVTSISNADVSALHKRIGLRSIYDANRTISLLGTMFKLAVPWKYFAEDPNPINPARGIKHFDEVERDRWVTPEELPRLAAAIDKEQNVYARAAIWLYLLTGVRKSELLKVKWSDIDFHRRELRLADTKASNNHYLPLSDAAISVIDRIPRQAHNPFVICGKLPGKAMVNISKPWNRIREKAGVEDVRLHDLRRTVGSWLAQRGNSLHLIGRVLNQSDSDTTKIYARFGQDHIRQALDSMGNEMIAIARNQPGCDIVAIKPNGDDQPVDVNLSYSQTGK